ncbi:MAG: hypothetical protein KC492_29160, partial [Myxococcales bacterium]|nr:hypothetical protein [Myxococcales bacterium]
MRTIARKQRPTFAIAGLSLAAVLGGAPLVACGSDEPVGSDLGGSGAEGGDAGAAGAGAGGEAGAGGSAGSSGGAAVGRADPANFPETCDDSCETACARLDECGGADSEYPVDRETCVSLCGLARGGPVWDDISGNFRCCTSQASCGDVQNCGGYLTVPDPVNACKQLCNCLVGPSTAPSPPEGAVAPPGYTFSTDSVVVRRLAAAQASPTSAVSPGSTA